MARVRVLVGTKKGGFILTSDAGRQTWEITGPLFEGYEVLHMQESAVDPDRLYASVWSPWSGAIIHRSEDGGRTWTALSGQFQYIPPVDSYTGLSGQPQPWQFRRVWSLQPVPGPGAAETLLAGVEDAALFRSTDGGASWTELSALRHHPTHSLWEPGAGGCCLHTILADPEAPGRLYTAISAAGVFRSDDEGQSWRPVNKGLRAEWIPDQETEAGYCVHRIALHPARPHVLFQQNHCGVYRSDDRGETWQEITEGLPSDFGFPIVIHAHEPDTVYVVPMTGGDRRWPPGGSLRVYRSRDGGGTWEPLGNGLPDRHCYVNVLRSAMSVDQLDPCGLYMGTTAGQVFASRDEGARWTLLVDHLPRVLSVEVQTLEG